MLDDKRKEESKSLIKQLIDTGKMIKPERNQIKFFLDKSVESFNLAKRVLEISEDEEDNLKSHMWVVAIAYYSMFFAGTSLLAFFNHQINEKKGIHKLTYHALVYYFLIDDNKLQKHFIEEYQDAYVEAEELLKISESKAFSMLQDFDFEMAKRKRFTYEMGEIAELNKARTSVKRANEFLIEARKIISL